MKIEFVLTFVTIWLVIKWLGLPLFILAVIALCTGSLPDNVSRPGGDMLRWIFWPLLALWFIIIFIRGLVL